MRLPKKIKKKWLKALRSGEYGQTKGVLTDGEGNFCCLGVLQHCVSGGKVEVYDGTDEFKCVPSPEWYRDNGIEVRDYAMNVFDEDERTLTRFNDGGFDYGTGKMVRRRNFNQIADWIEKNIGTID